MTLAFRAHGMKKEGSSRSPRMLESLARTGGKWLRECARLTSYHKLHGRNLLVRDVTGYECIASHEHANTAGNL